MKTEDYDNDSRLTGCLGTVVLIHNRLVTKGYEVTIKELKTIIDKLGERSLFENDLDKIYTDMLEELMTRL